MLLDAVLNKTVTAWRLQYNDLQLDFDDGGTLAICGIVDEDDDPDIEMNYFDDVEVEEDEAPERPTAQGKYAALAESVQNVYSHKVEVNSVSGALYCVGCLRENSELGKEPCDV